jgi:hypothetical protein
MAAPADRRETRRLDRVPCLRQALCPALQVRNQPWVLRRGRRIPPQPAVPLPDRRLVLPGVVRPHRAQALRQAEALRRDHLIPRPLLDLPRFRRLPRLQPLLRLP